MANLANAFVALPGCFGTMEELFEIITWNQIGIINKPVTLMSWNGFFQPLLDMIYQAEAAGFIKKENIDILQTG